MAAKWPLVAVEEFAEVATGGTPSTSIREYWEGGTIPWLNSGELNKGVITDSENFVTEAGLKNSSARMMPENTVLIALTGATTGISALLKIEACANQSVTGVLPSEKHDPSFLLQYLRSIRGRIVSDSWGGAQKHISQGYVKEMKIPLPPLAEQRRIAAVLDQADALRAKRRAALAQLDSLTQSIFLEMFGDPATNPKGWPRHLLGELANKITDGEHLNPVFSTSGMPIVMAGNVLEDGIDFGSAKTVEKEIGHRFRKKCGPTAGDVLLVSRGATIGRQCVVTSDLEFCLMGSVILIKPHRDKLDPLFLNIFLRLPGIRIALYKTSGSSAQQAIYLKDLKSLSCVSPPIPLQREFARRVTAVEKLKTAHRASLAELDALFATLQHRAFKGDL